MNDDLPPNDHNKPKTALDFLRDRLMAESASFDVILRQRLDEISRLKVDDDDSAGRATALAGIFHSLWKEIDEVRVEHKAPFLEGSRVVDSHFHSLLHAANEGKLTAAGHVDAYRRRIAEKARKERQEAEEAARKLNEQAERTRAVSPTVAEDLVQEAQTLVSIAEAHSTRQVAVVRSDYGHSASGRKVKTAVIEDWDAAYEAVKTNSKVRDAIQTAINALVRSGQEEIKGVRIDTDTKTVIRSA